MSEIKEILIQERDKTKKEFETHKDLFEMYLALVTKHQNEMILKEDLIKKYNQAIEKTPLD